MTSPVVVAVSQATRAAGSSARMASRMASETWSHILSGCPSVTDSEVKRYWAASMMLVTRSSSVGCRLNAQGSIREQPRPAPGRVATTARVVRPDHGGSGGRLHQDRWPWARSEAVLHAQAAMVKLPDHVDPALASELLADWGFLADPDLPHRPGSAYLLVAIRAQPTLRHYDPEL